MTFSYSDIKELITKTRTYRRFGQNRQLDIDILNRLIDLARLGGSARNGQPFQFMNVVDKKICDSIFPCLGWAGYLPDWQGPEPEEQPHGYILCFLNQNRLNVGQSDALVDLGIFSQNILLGATTLGLGGCRIGSISPKITKLFSLPSHLKLQLVIALGAPGEKVVLEQSQSEDDTRYWRDNSQIHHVPKRPLDELLITLPLQNDV